VQNLKGLAVSPGEGVYLSDGSRISRCCL